MEMAGLLERPVVRLDIQRGEAPRGAVGQHDPHQLLRARIVVVEPGVHQQPLERGRGAADARRALRSEEHTSELQSLMRISYAVFCLKKKTQKQQTQPPGNSNNTMSNIRLQQTAND